MNTTTPQYTPETGEGSPSLANFTIQKLERELNEAREQLEAMERAGAEQARRADENREWALGTERERNEVIDQLEAMREAIKEAHEALDWATSNMNPPFAWEPFKKANAALTKLQPFLP